MTELGEILSERQRRWLTAFLVTGTTAFALVIISYAATTWNFFGDVIFTFFLAWLLAFILTPPVTAIMRAIPGLPRIVAVVVVYTVLTLVLFVLVLVIADNLVRSVTDFIGSLPDLREKLPGILKPWETWLQGLGFQVQLVDQANSFLNSLGETATSLLGPLQALAVASLGVLGNLLIVFFLSVFIVIDKDAILSFTLRLVPPRYADEARLLETSISRSFGGFLRGQAVIGLVYAAVAFVTSFVLGLQYLPVTTAVAGLLMAIPFFGPFVSWAPPVLVAVFTLPQATIPAIILMGIGWFIVMNIVSPRVMADAVGIPPVVVFASFLIGTKVAGVAGAIFGLPIAAVISSVVMYALRRSRPDTGPVAVRAARRLEAREGRPHRVPREPRPGEDEDVEAGSPSGSPATPAISPPAPPIG
jgi:predicted PurR-regulated permease PerM